MSGGNAAHLSGLAAEYPAPFIADGTADIVLTSLYLSRGIQRACWQSVLGEAPLWLITARDGPYAYVSWDDLSAYDIPHFASYAWEESPEQARRRVEYEYIRLHRKPRAIRVMDNLDSVYISVRLGGGVTICPDNDKLRAAGVFKYVESPRSATICLTRLQANTSPHAVRFECFIKDYCDRIAPEGGTLE